MTIRTKRTKLQNSFFFFADWCPHSTEAKPIIDAVSKLYDNKKINGYTLKVFEINSETDEKKLENFEKTYNRKIEGFPTIYLVKGDTVIEFDAEITAETIDEFLHAAL